MDQTTQTLHEQGNSNIHNELCIFRVLLAEFLKYHCILQFLLYNVIAT